ARADIRDTAIANHDDAVLDWRMPGRVDNSRANQCVRARPDGRDRGCDRGEVPKTIRGSTQHEVAQCGLEVLAYRFEAQAASPCDGSRHDPATVEPDRLAAP